VRRALFVTVAGLIFAFTFFYVAAWPSTIEAGSSRSADKTLAVSSTETVWVPLGPIHIVGRKKVMINTVQLNRPSVGIEFVDSRIDIGHDPGGPTTSQTFVASTFPAAPGAILTSGQKATIYIAFSVSEPGSYSFRGIAISYQAGWLTRTAIIGPTVRATAE